MSVNYLDPKSLDLGWGAMTDPGWCWICTTTATPEYHHVIERSCGGEAGPQVRLCSNCHHALHKVADRGQSQLHENAAAEFQLTEKNMLRRIEILAIMILTARQSVKNDPNKSAVFMDRFPADTRRQLRELGKLLKMKGGQRSIVRAAIKEMHARFFH